MKIFLPIGHKNPVPLKPLSARLPSLKGKKIAFFFSWQSGTLYDGRFAEKLANKFKEVGVDIEYRYKRKAFDQNDPAERADLAKLFDGVIYFGASSCSTSKFAAIFGGLLDSENQVPTVVVTYETFVKDCEHANYDNGTKTRVLFTDYPGNDLAEEAISKVFEEIKEGFTKELSSEEMQTGNFEFPDPEELADLEDPQKYFFDNGLTDSNPIVVPTLEKVQDMLKGTSLFPDEIISRNIWPNCSYATVKTVAVVAVMAGLSKEALPACCALTKAYGDAPGQALVVSTNSFGFLPVFKGKIVEQLNLNYREHAMSSVPNAMNAPLGRFLRLLQIAVGGWKQGENAFGVIGNPLLGAPAVAENPEYSDKTNSVVTLYTGCWSMFGNYMNMDFDTLMQMAKLCDYQTGLFCIISPSRAQDLIRKFGSLEKAGEWYQENAKIPLKDFWDKQDWHKVFTKPQLELGSSKGELTGYPKDYLDYFNDPSAGERLVPAFPKGGIRFVVTGGSASKMLRAVHGLPVSQVSIEDYE